MLTHALLLALGLTLVCGMSTVAPHTTKAHHHHSHAPKPSHEPAVESHVFRYFVNVHQLVLRTKGTCYVMSLSGSELTDIHSPSGLRQLEVQLLNAVDNTALHTKVDASAVDKHVASLCNAHKTALAIFMVN